MSVLEINDVEIGNKGIAVYQWPHPSPRYLLLILHGHNEHMGLYESVAKSLHAHGAFVFGPDHLGHGLSHGERLVIEDFDRVVNDVQITVATIRIRYPTLPLIIIGHSMGGMIATRYVQLNKTGQCGLVLSAPLLGDRTRITNLAIKQPRKVAFTTSVNSIESKIGDSIGPFKCVTLAAMDRTRRLIHSGPGFENLPVLWLYGSEDTIVLAKETQTTIDRLKGTYFVTEPIPGAQHNVFSESHLAVTLSKVISFIDSVL